MRGILGWKQFKNLKALKLRRHLAKRPVIEGALGCDGSGEVIFPGYRLVFEKGFARIVYLRAGPWRTYGLLWRDRQPRRKPTLPRSRWMAPDRWDSFFEAPGADLPERNQPALPLEVDWSRIDTTTDADIESHVAEDEDAASISTAAEILASGNRVFPEEVEPRSYR